MARRPPQRHGKDRVYYEPTNQGIEQRCKERLEQIKAWKKQQEKKQNER